MNTQTHDETISISREKLVSIVSQLSEPRPIPWRFDRIDSSQTSLELFAHFNQLIWEVIGGGKFNTAELNPQPIPPRSVLIADLTRHTIDRLLLIQEVADAINQTNGGKSKLVIGDSISQLVEGWCGNEPFTHSIRIRIPHPFPDPYPFPRPEWNKKLSGLELLTAGAIIEQTAKNIAREDLRQELRSAGTTLIEAGISRM